MGIHTDPCNNNTDYYYYFYTLVSFGRWSLRVTKGCTKVLKPRNQVNYTGYNDKESDKTHELHIFTSVSWLVSKWQKPFTCVMG